MALAAAPATTRALDGWRVLPSSAANRLLTGSETPAEIYGRGDREYCFAFKNKVVHAVDNISFHLLERSGPPLATCETQGTKSGFRIQREGPFYFFGYRYPWLFLDSGTGQDRGFHAYDTRSGVETATTVYYDPIRLRGQGVSLWQPLPWLVSSICDFVTGYSGSRLEVLRYVHLPTGTHTTIPMLPRCSYGD